MTTARIKLAHPRYTDENSPFFMDYSVVLMRERWEIMRAVTSGTEYLHKNAEVYLPRAPRENPIRAENGENYDPWKARVNRSVLAPFVERLIHNAAGMILRRKIKLEGGDPFWEKEFRKDVDGDGTSLDEFAKKRLEVSLTYGMSSLIVDAPSVTASSGADEINGVRPFFVPIDPWQYLGYRRESDDPGAKLEMFRYEELRKVNKGTYGEEYVWFARVMIPGRYVVIEAGKETGKTGPYALDRIPLVNIYTKKEGFLCASPPLADLAHLNIAHYRKLADLLHSLHIAAMGLLVLEDYEGKDATSGLTYAIRMTTGSKAYWVSCDAGSFVAQAELLDRLENEISHLGVTRLLGQKFVAESAEAKRIDQGQANCVLAVAAEQLEAALNEAFGIAALYYKKDPPKVEVNKDFDFYRLLGQDVSVLSDLEDKGQITTDLFHKILRNGEWIPDDTNMVDLGEQVKLLKERARQFLVEQQTRAAIGPATAKKAKTANA